MHKWSSMIEYLQFPLKIVVFGCFLLVVSTTAMNSNLQFLFQIKNQQLILLFQILQKLGIWIIQLMPFIIFIKVLSKRFVHSAPVVIGCMSYFCFMLFSFFLYNSNFASYFYQGMLGIQLPMVSSTVYASVVRTPYHLGYVSFFLVYFIVSMSYQKSRYYQVQGLFSFIDHDTWAFIISMVVSALMGIVVSFLWPFVMKTIEMLFQYIAMDITDPLRLFFYGITERFANLFGFIELPRNAFWFSELGGTYTDSFGIKYAGDAAVWAFQQMEQIDVIEAGRFMTPQYILNLFMIPAYMIAYVSVMTSKKDKMKGIVFITVAILISICGGIQLPVEITMFVLSPLVYFVYVFMSGILYALLQMMQIHFGMLAAQDTVASAAASIFDLLPFATNPNTFMSFVQMGILGCVSFLCIFFVTRKYFKQYAIGFFSMHNAKEISQRVIEALGGYDNIISSSATPDKMIVDVKDKQCIDFEALTKEGAYLILESRDGYLIRLSNLSCLISNTIENYRKENQGSEEHGTVESNS